MLVGFQRNLINAYSRLKFSIKADTDQSKQIPKQ